MSVHYPRVSVAVATFNGARFLEAQLDSILAQTHPPSEIVISDDASADDTLALLHSFRAREPQIPIRIIENSENVGYVQNFARAVAVCTGDLIFLADQDDVWYPAKVQRFVDLFTAKPECALVFSNAEVVDEQLNPLDRFVYTKDNLPDFELRSPVAGFLKLIPVKGCTLAFRAAYRPAILPFPDEGWGHDHWIVFLLAALADICMLNEPLMMYRRHAANTGSDPFLLTSRKHKFARYQRALTAAAYEEDYVRWQAAAERLASLQTGELIPIDTQRYAQHLAQVHRRLWFAQQRRQNRHQSRWAQERISFPLLHRQLYKDYANGVRSIIRDLLA